MIMINIEIKDAAGLSKPITKLISVVGQGIGLTAEPALTVINAHAEAHAIKVIAKAVKESQLELFDSEVEYQGNGMLIKKLPTASLSQHDCELVERALQKITVRELNKQINIEKIISQTGSLLKNEEHCADEEVDPIWASKFFKIAEDVSKEDLQILWSKILAREITQPGSYSIRTLEFLNSITKKEAELIIKMARLSICCDGKCFIPGNNQIQEKYGLTVDDILLLQELGLLPSSSSMGLQMKPSTDNIVTHFFIGDMVLIANIPAGFLGANIRALPLSQIGKELLSIIQPSPEDDYLIETARQISHHENIKFQTAKIIKVEAERIHYDQLKDISL